MVRRLRLCQLCLNASLASLGHSLPSLLRSESAATIDPTRQRDLSVAWEGSDFVKHPNQSANQIDPPDDDMEAVQLQDFDVSVYAYKHSEVISDTLRSKHAWEPDGVGQLCNEWKQYGSKGNFVDIGANIGTYTLPLASCIYPYGKLVIAVEAIPSNARHIRAGIQYNGLDNIRLYEYAVGQPASVTYLDMIEPDVNEGNSHAASITVDSYAVKANKKHKVVRASFTTIDAIAEVEGNVTKNIFAMKIDIEGMEQYAFMGAKQFLSNGPCIIMMELKYSMEHLKILRGIGYKVMPPTLNSFVDTTVLHRRDFDECIAKLN